MVRFKKTPRISLHGNIRPHFPRPDIDILLSLKDPVYSSVMFGYFQSMGEKTTTDNTTTDANEDEGEETPESVVAKKALLHFKEDCPYVKFFVKLPRDGIYEEIFEQVDDPEALESEFHSILFPKCCIIRINLDDDAQLVLLSLLAFIGSNSLSLGP
jgi:hypothetical protein